jgi:glycosyltransferase involved in cell wall biosynthesis
MTLLNPEYMTVIIPVYRDWARLKLCLDKLSVQTLPADQFEVIVVNNDPSDPCPYALPASNMRIISEGRKSSYAARNAGIREAKGEVMAFTDSDCLPDARWLEEGLKFIADKDAFQTGGRIDFVFSNPNSAAELLDASTHMDNERSIARHSCAATANLFVKRDVFTIAGLFDEGVQSGGDMAFTQRATALGFRIRFCPDAVVAHPTRSFREGLKKAIRVGWGFPGVELNKSAGFWKKARTVVLYLIPLANPGRVRLTMRRYKKRSRWLFFRTMLLSVFFGLVHDAVFLGYLAAYPFRRKSLAGVGHGKSQA